MDSESERRRIEAVYSTMTEGELRKVADDARSLTEDALQILRTEIARRGLDIPTALSPTGIDVLEQQEVVTIRKFRDLPEAMLAKGLVESAGIECFLADDNMVRMDWFISNFIGGIKLQVKVEDATAANEVLEQPIPDHFEVDDVGEYDQPRCPKCESLDVTFEGLNKPVAYTTAWVGLPIPLHNKGWKCRSCGHEWNDV